jgi:outer membrane protein assembly factor BamB
VCFLVGVNGVRADWPQFQGPDRNGISKETGLAKSWPEKGPRVLWEVAVGAGYAAPAIRDGEVYFLDRTTDDDADDRKDVLRCLDLETGKEKWTFAYDAPGKTSHDGSRNPASVDATHVFTIGPFGDLYCFDRKTQKPVWNINLLTDLDGKKGGWGVGQSPLLYGDWVIVAVQGDDIGLAAFEKTTGKMVWKSKGLGKAGYVSPTLATIDGVDQVLFSSAKARAPGGRDKKGGKSKKAPAAPAPTPAGPAGPSGAYGISAKTGDVLWNYAGWGCDIPIPAPSYLGDGKILITGGYEAGSAMIQVKGASVKELFKLEFGSQIQQPIRIGDHFFFDNNENSRRDGLACMTLDGKVTWQTKDLENGPKFDRGNLMMADGMIYAIDAAGNLKMIKPDPKKYTEVASAALLDGKEIWAPIALSGGKMVIRDQTKMLCVDVKTP